MKNLKLVVRKLLCGKFIENYAEFTRDNKSRIYDYQIAEFVIKHFKLWDWLNPYKVATGMSWAFQCLHDEIIYGSDPEEVWKEMF